MKKYIAEMLGTMVLVLTEEVSPASPMKRDRSTSPTVTASPERSPSGLRSMRTNMPITESPTIRISRAST